jgi:hypothetical protein
MPATNSRIDQLRRLFAHASDAELRQLHTQGAERYTFDAWHALDKEFGRRGLGNNGGTVDELPAPRLRRGTTYVPIEAVRNDSTPLSEPGEKGQRRLRIAGTLLFFSSFLDRFR